MKKAWTAAATVTVLAMLVAAAAGGEAVERLVEVYQYRFDEDLDSDGQPDLWARTVDRTHPHYVTGGLDGGTGEAGGGSLAIRAGGAPAEYLSPPVEIVKSAAYDVSGFVKTEGLPSTGMRSSKAYIEVRLYDERKAQVASVVGFPEAAGTTGWLAVSLLDVARRHPQATYLRVATVVEGLALSGEAWFDTIEVRKRPIAFLKTNREANAFGFSDEKTLYFDASGLPEGDYLVSVSVFDQDDAQVHHVELETRSTPEGTAAVVYPLPDLPVGPYQVRIALSRGEVSVLSQMVRIGVLPDYVGRETAKNLGVSLTRFPDDSARLVLLMQIFGAGWLKVPLGAGEAGVKTEQLLTINDLRRSGVTPVGVLDAGETVSDLEEGVQNADSNRWVSAFGDTVTTFAGRVQAWQLGTESQTGALDIEGGGEAFSKLRDFINEVCFSATVGASMKTAPRSDTAADFASIEARVFGLTELEEDAYQSWVWLSPEQWNCSNPEEASTQMAGELAALYASGASIVFFKDPWTSQGILDTEGNITPFGMALSTFVHELANHHYAGSISFPNETPNAVYADGKDTKVVLWPGPAPTTEKIFLGEALDVIDIYGRRIAAKVESGENVIEVVSAPLILDRVDQSVVNTRQTFKVEPEVIDSAYEVQPIYVSFVNKFENSIIGELTLKFPTGWDANPKTFTVRLKPDESFRGRTNLVVPYSALSGFQEMQVTLDVGGAGTQKTTIIRQLELGSLAFAMETETRFTEGDIMAYQKVTNISDRAAYVSAFVEGEGLERVERLRNLAAGSSTTFSYSLSDAAKWSGKTLRASVRDISTNRFLNHQFQIPAFTTPQ